MDRKIILLVLVAAVLAFYWFGFRPESIRKNCNQKATEESVKSVSFEDEPDVDKREALQYRAQQNYYTSCLQENGLSN